MMGVDVDNLPSSPRKSGGYGGKIALRLLTDVMLVFAAANGTAKCIQMPEISVQWAPTELLKQERGIYSIPTVLGTDVLSSAELTLWADWKTRQAHLDFL